MGSRRGSRTASRVGVGLIATSVAGCTTLPFAPTEGAGGHLTLATAAHVSRESEDLRRGLENELDQRIETVQAARDEDRERLAALERVLETREQELAGLEERIDRGQRALEEISTLLAERVDRAAQASTEARERVERLETQLDRIPLETLRELRDAIDSRLRERAPADEPRPPSGP